MGKQKELYSIHKFMFPFRFDKSPESGIKDKYEFLKEVSFDNRVRKAINNQFKTNMEKSGWEYKRFERSNSLDYNRYVYFYDFVRDGIFNEDDFQENATSYLFMKDLSNFKEQDYTITIKKREEEIKRCELEVKDSNGESKSCKLEIKESSYKFNSYKLKIKEVSLKIFDTGVAILTFHLENYNYKNSEDILRINDYGRRIYPQFLGENFDINKPKESFLADSISVCGIEDNFIRDESYIKKNGVYLPKFITEILGENLFTTDKEKGYMFYIQPILDDRMFTLCWYGSDNFKGIIPHSDIDSCNSYLNSDDWYRFIFVDGGYKSIADIDMQKELVKKSTYSRWIDYNTVFGISRYSFIAVSDREWFSLNILLNHTDTIYYDLMTILIAQRASLIRFSDEITAISDIEPDNNLSDKIENLYKNYLRFKNKLYFKEVTAQEQGIELYDQAKGIMRIDEQIDDLSKEINSLNSYAYILEEKEEKSEMNKLTKLGAKFLPATLVAGMLGMNVIPEDNIKNIVGLSLSVIFIVLLFLIPVSWIKNIIDIDFIKIKEFIKSSIKSIKHIFNKDKTKN